MKWTNLKIPKPPKKLIWNTVPDESGYRCYQIDFDGSSYVIRQQVGTSNFEAPIVRDGKILGKDSRKSFESAAFFLKCRMENWQLYPSTRQYKFKFPLKEFRLNGNPYYHLRIGKISYAILYDLCYEVYDIYHFPHDEYPIDTHLSLEGAKRVIMTLIHEDAIRVGTL